MTCLAWASSLALLGGTFLVARKDWFGWVLGVLGCAGWSLWAGLNDNAPLLAVNVAFGLMNTYGLALWGTNKGGGE